MQKSLTHLLYSLLFAPVTCTLYHLCTTSPPHLLFASFPSTPTIALYVCPFNPQLVPSPRLPSLISHNAFPINFLFVKLNHHLLGLPSPPSSYILASNLVASSCRTWARYCRRTSESWRSRGGSNICLFPPTVRYEGRRKGGEGVWDGEMGG